MKDKEREGLLKVPDEVVIKELRIELGKANAMISELQDIVKNLETSDVKSLIGTIKALNKQINENVYYQKWREEKTKCKKLSMLNKRLITRLIQHNIEVPA